MIRAKLKCLSAHRFESSEAVELTAVYSPDPESPNYSWSQATPSGSVKLTITNPDAFGALEPGREYLVSFEEAPTK